MARIAYGISSEGMGHATRSNAVIEHLQEQGHDVHIFTSDRAYDFFEKKNFNQLYRIKGFHLIYKGDELANTTSFFNLFKTLPKDFFPTLRTIANEFYTIKPDIIVSDFEFFTAFFGKHLGIPVISANNISIVDRTKIDVQPFKLMYSKLMATTTAQLATYLADHYVIPSFFFPKPKSKNVHLTDPVVREEIRNAKPTEGKHVLVYQTSPTCLGLLRMLNKIDEEFIVYGFGKKRNRKHLTFYDFNTTKFIRHLASAKAVVIGGGFSLLSEALYLKKPIMSVPLNNHFEQIVNAYYVEKCKFGEYRQNPTVTDVHDFLLKLPLYKHYLAQYDLDPLAFAKKVASLVKKHAKEPSGRRLKALKVMLGNNGADT
jgi:uncharacterized protein (TIGR00661 family)